VQYINKSIIDRFCHKNSVIFGQNIVAGSRISGLGSNLDSQPGITAINTPNVENSLMGFGLGMMINGTDSAFIMKQHDFALLGLDQITNTVNVAKTYNLKASFILIMVVVDSGYEGPQASLNNLDEFASLSRSPVYFLNSQSNIDDAFESSKTPGFHIMALSQKNMKNSVLSYPNTVHLTPIGHIVENSPDSKILIVYFGLDLGYLNEIESIFNADNFTVDLLIVSRIQGDMSIDSRSISKYSSILVVETSKAEVTYAQKLTLNLMSFSQSIMYVGRQSSLEWSCVNPDRPEVTPAEIFNKWKVSQNEK
jgi:pyruvate/2-oxoglutarate/acetoin dehydrogenase E1 component